MPLATGLATPSSPATALATAWVQTKLLTVKEVRAILRVSAFTIYQLCERHKLTYKRVAGKILIAEDDLAAYLRSVEGA